jgi:hypothetical protein
VERLVEIVEARSTSIQAVRIRSTSASRQLVGVRSADTAVRGRFQIGCSWFADHRWPPERTRCRRIASAPTPGPWQPPFVASEGSWRRVLEWFVDA